MIPEKLLKAALVSTQDKSARRSLLLNLLEGLNEGRINAQTYISILQHLGYDRSKEQAAEIADVLWMGWLLLGVAPSATSQDKIPGERFSTGAESIVNLTRELMREEYISKRVLMEVSEGEFMEAVGLITSFKDGWRKREIRANTRNVYAQKKYNMLREESEGYAKIITLLNQAGTGRVSQEGLCDMLAEMKSVIGYFDLDPNRVCSLIIDAYTSYPENSTFMELLKGFGNSRLVEMLGFRLSSDCPLNDGVYKVAATLVKENLAKLEDLLVHFTPNEETFLSAWKSNMVEVAKSVEQIGVISLATRQPEEKETTGTGKAREEINQQHEKPIRKAGQSARTIVIDAKRYISEMTGESDGKNHRLEFLAQLFRCGAWEEAIRFTKYLIARGMEDVAAFKNVGKALCDIISTELSGLGKKSPSERLNVSLQLVRYHLHYDLRTLSKTIRYVKWMFQQGQADLAEPIMVFNILPACTLEAASAALAHELWDALRVLPYTRRYKIYSDFCVSVHATPLLRASSKLAETEVRRILRRVTAPANRKEAKLAMRPISRLLAKISHACPFVVSTQLLRQVMGMPGMVLSISEALKYLTPLTFDVMTYSILKQLATGKKKLKDDGVNLEEWFQWLASFTGLLCRNQRYVHAWLLKHVIKSSLQVRDLNIFIFGFVVAWK